MRSAPAPAGDRNQASPLLLAHSLHPRSPGVDGGGRHDGSEKTIVAAAVLGVGYVPRLPLSSLLRGADTGPADAATAGADRRCMFHRRLESRWARSAGCDLDCVFNLDVASACGSSRDTVRANGARLGDAPGGEFRS